MFKQVPWLAAMLVFATFQSIWAQEEDAMNADQKPVLEIVPMQDASKEPSTGKETSPAVPLDQARIDQLLQRLGAKLASRAPVPIQLPPQQRPPPQSGETLETPFPPPMAEPKPEMQTEAARIVRMFPSGAADGVQQVGVVFSQPMVPMGAVNEPGSLTDLPVVLEPQPPQGQWRWIDPMVLVFESQAPLPAATAYRLRVPNGMQIGKTQLEAGGQTEFETTRPKMLGAMPSGTTDRDPLIRLQFNLPMDPTQVASAVQLVTPTGPIGTRVATIDEIAARTDQHRGPQYTDDPKTVWLLANQSLPKNTRIRGEISAGLVSLAGPLGSEKGQFFNFQTAGPLAFEGLRCVNQGREQDGTCSPLDYWELRFNNPLDSDSFDPSMLTVEPRLPNLDIKVNHRYLSVLGNPQVGQTYTISLQPGLRDQFGQVLTEPVSATVTIGPYEGRFIVLDGRGQIQDPALPPVFTFLAIGMEQAEVAIYRVDPDKRASWPRHDRNAESKAPPSQYLLHRQTLTFPAEARQGLVEKTVDLSPWQDEAKGLLLVTLKQTDKTDKPAYYEQLVQHSAIFPHIFQKPTQEFLFWATAFPKLQPNDPRDGAPLAGVQLRLKTDAGWQTVAGQTDQQGLLSFSLTDSSSQIHWLEARRGKQRAYLFNPPIRNRYGRQTQQNSVVTTVSDRGLYRLGEQGYLKGWLREMAEQRQPSGTVTYTQLTYTLNDAMDNLVGEGKVPLSAWGSFHLDFTVPSGAALGPVSLALTAITADGQQEAMNLRDVFQIEAFRQPEFEVDLTWEDGTHTLANTALAADLQANYYTGGPLPDADTDWRARLSSASYQPPGWTGFQFGQESMPWYRIRNDQAWPNANETGLTDANGQQRLGFRVSGIQTPVSLNVDASVTDLNNQRWTASANRLIHPANITVGLKTDRYFIPADGRFDLHAIVVDLDGTPQAGRQVTLFVEQLTWERADDQWQEVVAASEEHTITSGDAPQALNLKPLGEGPHRLRAVVFDHSGGISVTQLRRYVSGGGFGRHGLDEPQLTMIPDKETYEPGDVAEVMVQIPFQPATLLVGYGKTESLKYETHLVTGGSKTLRVPIGEDLFPGIQLTVEAMGATPRLEGSLPADFPGKVTTITGQVTLPIQLTSRELTVEVQPAQAFLPPGANTQVAVQVTDYQGQAVANAEVALAVVDESVLALSNHTWPNPLTQFYPAAYSTLWTDQAGDIVATTDPLIIARRLGFDLAALPFKNLDLLPPQDLLDRGIFLNLDFFESNGPMMRYSGVADLATRPSRQMRSFAAGRMEESMAMSAPMVESDGEQPTTVALRTNLTPLAVFVPQAKTDGSGQVTIPFTLPDNLTRYRVMAIAIHNTTHAGAGEAALTARKPLMVRPSPPRFLNLGDSFQLPVTVENPGSTPMTVDVAVRAANLNLDQGAGWRVEVPAQDRAIVHVPASTMDPGEVAFQVIAANSDDTATDAVGVQFPSYTPATSQAFAMYRQIDDAGFQLPVDLPDDVFLDVGGLQVTTSSTALQSLTDAYLYLADYPFDCTEQVASRLLSVLALSDVLQAFDLVDNPDQIRQAIARDIKTLEGRILSNQGMAFWPGRSKVNVYATIHAANALISAQQADYAVSQQSINALQRPMQRWADGQFPGYLQPNSPTLRAYALATLTRMGQPNPRLASKLAQTALDDQQPLEVLGWLLPLLPAESHVATAVMARIEGSAILSAATASFEGGYGNQGFRIFFSNTRQEAVVLDALLQVQPQHDLVPKLLAGLMQRRARGRWYNTQDNAFALLAANRYFRFAEAVEPDFIARMWLGDTYVGDERFTGRETSRRQLTLPMRWLAQQGDTMPLTVTKEGAGRLYVRIGMDWAPDDFMLPAKQAGFQVERQYDAVDNPSDVQRDEDGRWYIRAGATVKVTLTMRTSATRYHLALVDRLPAGMEPLNPSLAVQAAPPENEAPNQPFSFWWRRWYNHQNLRDERSEAFTDVLAPGSYTYSYHARATTLGEFIAPPAKAEEMYAPETFGNSATDHVVIVE